MKEHEVILGESEDEIYAEVARRELISLGIRASRLKERVGKSSHLIQSTDGVKLTVIASQLEQAKKILSARFI